MVISSCEQYTMYVVPTDKVDSSALNVFNFVDITFHIWVPDNEPMLKCGSEL